MRKLVLIVTLFLLATMGRADDFPSWMAGSWTGQPGGVKMEEHWTSPGGGLMLGMHRDVMPNRKTSFEFLRIEMKDGKLAYLAMPSGRPATTFPMKTMTGSRIVFENLEHDFPQRIIYWRDGKKLCARVEGTIQGKSESEEWCWGAAATSHR